MLSQWVSPCSGDNYLIIMCECSRGIIMGEVFEQHGTQWHRHRQKIRKTSYFTDVAHPFIDVFMHLAHWIGRCVISKARRWPNQEFQVFFGCLLFISLSGFSLHPPAQSAHAKCRPRPNTHREWPCPQRCALTHDAASFCLPLNPHRTRKYSSSRPKTEKYADSK